jgi:hypothetical protein
MEAIVIMGAIEIVFDISDIDDGLKRLSPIALKQLIEASRDDRLSLLFDIIFKQRTPAIVARRTEKIVIGLRLSDSLKEMSFA